MQGRYSIHAPLLVKTLLQHFISQEKAPSGIYRSSGGGSVVIGLACMSILRQGFCGLYMLARKGPVSLCVHAWMGERVHLYVRGFA
jgi:uncharacterized protein YjeT (DUF2065 family)